MRRQYSPLLTVCQECFLQWSADVNKVCSEAEEILSTCSVLETQGSRVSLNPTEAQTIQEIFQNVRLSEISIA